MAIHQIHKPASQSFSGETLRRIMLEVIAKYSQQGPSYFQSGPILREVTKRLQIGHGDDVCQQAVLTYWYDLFRAGTLAWGFNLSNPDPPFCHLTEQGREALKHLSRDPANPDGYLAHLDGHTKINPISRSYLEEALKTYNANCYKACAVMVGAAAERLILELRDALVVRIANLGRPIPKKQHDKLNDWRIKTIYDAISVELQAQRQNMSNKLAEAFVAYWPAFVQQVRSVRNDAGHPNSIAPVTQESVHAALLVFPEYAKLASELQTWVSKSYQSLTD